MDIEFSTDIKINKLDENGTKKLLLTEYQWHLLDTYLFKYISTEKSIYQANAWMLDQLEEFIEKVEEGWDQ